MQNIVNDFIVPWVQKTMYTKNKVHINIMKYPYFQNAKCTFTLYIARQKDSTACMKTYFELFLFDLLNVSVVYDLL